ncbi:MAG: flagellar basal body rod protein FlgB [Methylomonas sp.]
MAINFNNALSIHPQALALREKRSEILAANLANADTPDYKARDLDFKAVLKQTLSGESGLKRTSQGHMDAKNTVLGAELLYRNPQTPSLDGNTVEAHIEQAKYAENAVQYQASLQFINEDFKGLISAIRGD